MRRINMVVFLLGLTAMLLGYLVLTSSRTKSHTVSLSGDTISTDFNWGPLPPDQTSPPVVNNSAKGVQNASLQAESLQFEWQGRSAIQWDKLYPAKSVINRFERPFVIEPRKICEDSPFLVILVFSVHSHGNVRDAIRKTWGSIVNGKSWPGGMINVEVKLLFIFGRPSSPEMEFIIKMESKTFRDVLQADFPDVYNNLTLKSLAGLRFILQFCPDVEYVMKADEDTFTNIPVLVHFLQRHMPSHAVIGHMYTTGSRVHRLGKWRVDNSVYPMQEYPIYASGNTYVLSADLLPCLLNISHYIPYMPIEDVHVTGIAAAMCDARHMHVQGFTYWSEVVPSICDVVHGTQITSNRIRPEMALDIWKSIMGYPCE